MKMSIVCFSPSIILIDYVWGDNMSSISQDVGIRIRMYRLRQGLTQEQLAEKANLHNTYIGQVERGEKNLTLVSLEKILQALGIPFSAFFEYMGPSTNGADYAAQCYSLISSKQRSDQLRFLRILQEIDSLTK